jgi:hypothetical protein
MVELQGPSRRRRLIAAAVVFLLSFAFRALHAVDLAPSMGKRGQPGLYMSRMYDDRALEMMLAGDGWLYPANPDPARTGLLARPPGYPILLVAIDRTLGRSAYLVQLIQNVISSLASVALLLLGESLCGFSVGLVAALLAAVAPSLACGPALISPEAISALLLLAASVLLAKGAAAGEPPLAWRAVAAGLVFGVATWLRPNYLLLGAFLAVVLSLALRRPRAAFVRLLALPLGTLLLVAPITYRNYRVFGAFVPVSINGGITFWEGIADAGGLGFGARPKDQKVARLEAERQDDERYRSWWAEPDGIERDRRRYRDSLDVIRRRPLWYLGAMVRRMGRMFRYDLPDPPLVGSRPPDEPAAAEPWDDELGRWPAVLSPQATLSPGRALGVLRPLARLLQQLERFSLLPLALLGLVLVLRSSWRLALWIAAVPLYFLLFESMFMLEWRYILPMHYYVFLFAAAGLLWLCRQLRARVS